MSEIEKEVTTKYIVDTFTFTKEEDAKRYVMLRDSRLISEMTRQDLECLYYKLSPALSPIHHSYYDKTTLTHRLYFLLKEVHENVGSLMEIFK